MNEELKEGIYICGAGIAEIAHITREVELVIEESEVIIHLGGSPGLQTYIEDISRGRVINLQHLYSEGSPRLDTYDRISSRVLEEAAKAKRTCFLAVGNPVFLNRIVQLLIRECLAERRNLSVLAGVSCLDTVFSDLRWDPGATGFQCYEIGLFIQLQPVFDTSVPLILLQPGTFGTDRVRLRVAPTLQDAHSLQEALLRHFAPDTQWALVASSARLSVPALIVSDVMSKIAHYHEVLLAGTLVIPGSQAVLDTESGVLRHAASDV